MCLQSSVSNCYFCASCLPVVNNARELRCLAILSAIQVRFKSERPKKPEVYVHMYVFACVFLCTCNSMLLPCKGAKNAKCK